MFNYLILFVAHIYNIIISARCYLHLRKNTWSRFMSMRNNATAEWWRVKFNKICIWGN